MIELAQTKQLARARFLVGDCFKLSSICPKAGAVLSRGGLLSHYGQTQAIELLRNARACLEPGGFILWDFLNAAARHSFRHIPEKKAYYDSDEICAMAANADFSNVQVLGEPQRRVKLLLAGT